MPIYSGAGFVLVHIIYTHNICVCTYKAEQTQILPPLVLLGLLLKRPMYLIVDSIYFRIV